MKIGITGQKGFIGTHLYNFLSLKEGNELVPFERKYFKNIDLLDQFVSKCDVIVHLAAMNRHDNPQLIYDTNIMLVTSLIEACERTQSTPHILISSSTQEDRDNLYGQSKKVGRELLENWAGENGCKCTGMIIPNVFGPFGKPFYNSVVATFCHQVVKGETPTIIQDGTLSLIYINELVSDIYNIISLGTTGKVDISARHQLMVSQLRDKLIGFKKDYIDNDKFPFIDASLDLALFNTFRCYVPYNHYPRKFDKHTDERGSFVEIVRADTSGQFSYSTTVPGITRGNHFHTRKAERFAVIKGKARIQLRKVDTDVVIDYTLDGDQPSYVDMPIWHTHNITNIGDEELITLFWINEPYDSSDADTYFVNV